MFIFHRKRIPYSLQKKKKSYECRIIFLRFPNATNKYSLIK